MSKEKVFKRIQEQKKKKRSKRHIRKRVRIIGNMKVMMTIAIVFHQANTTVRKVMEEKIIMNLPKMNKAYKIRKSNN